jgi:glycosyltransferase involved in cell wall biosynthesis
MTTTIFECSGVGGGGITRVLSELVRYWPAGHRLQVVGAPVGWQPAAEAVADVEVASRQAASRERTIAGTRLAMAKVTSAPASSRPAKVVSLSPSLAISGSRLPVTTLVHDLAFRLWPRDLSRAVLAYRRASYGYAIRRSTELLSVSARTRHDLLGLYAVDPGRCRVWTPGGDVRASAGMLPGQLAAMQEAGRRYLLVAGHAIHKGVELAIEALALLPDVDLGVLTGGREVAEWQRFAGDLGLQDRVAFLDRIPDSEYVAALTSSAAFLMPSHFEGYGLPAVEAMRLGTPVVISPDPALAEATEGRAHRMLRWDAESLAAAVLTACRDAQPVLPVGRTWQEATEHLFAMVVEDSPPAGRTRAAAMTTKGQPG